MVRIQQRLASSSPFGKALWPFGTALLMSLACGLLIPLVRLDDRLALLFAVATASILLWGWILLRNRKGDLSTAISSFAFIAPVLAAVIVPPNEAGDTRNLMGVHFGVQGLLLSSMILYFLMLTGSPKNLRLGRNPHLQRGMLALALFAAFGFLDGVLHKNSFEYVISDAYKLLILLMVFALVSTIPRYRIRTILYALYAGLVLAQLITLGKGLDVETPRYGSAFFADNLALFLGSLGLIWLSKRRSSTWLGALGVLLALVVNTKMAYRALFLAYLLAIGLVVAIDLVVMKRRGVQFASTRRLLIPLLTCSLVVVVFWISNPNAAESIVWRFRILAGDTVTDLSLEGRILEIETILNRFKQGGVGTLLTGFGFGAQYELPPASNIYMVRTYVLRDYRVHAIHAFYLAIPFRSGVVGSFLWLVFQVSVLLALVSSFKKAIVLKDETGVLLTSWALLYFLLHSMLAIQIAVMDRDIPLAILVALSGLYGADEPDYSCAISKRWNMLLQRDLLTLKCPPRRGNSTGQDHAADLLP